MNAQETLEKIKALFEPSDIATLSDHEVIESYQAKYGLEVDGRLGPVTAREVERPRFCKTPDRLMAKGVRARWDHTNWTGTGWKNGTPSNMELTYCVAAALPGMSVQQTHAAFAEALGYWTAVCAVVFTRTDNPLANLYCQVGAIDGPSSTLAWCELPAGKDTPQTVLRAMFDSGEPWVNSADPPNARIDAVRVIAHELGHGLGLDHGPDGNLLAPYYDRTIRKPQAWDIDEVRLRYGPPVPVNSPSQPPGNPDAKAVVTVLLPNGVKYAGELEPTTI